jgi:hypothetical protein
VSRNGTAQPIFADMSTNPIDSLPPLPPQEMSSILGDSSALQTLGGAGAPESLPGTGAFLDLSTAALQMTSSEQVEMAKLEDDAALFGSTVGSSSFAAVQPDAFDWSKDLANPGFWA